jgi:hypothetical protein
MPIHVISTLLWSVDATADVGNRKRGEDGTNVEGTGDHPGDGAGEAELLLDLKTKLQK